MVEHTLIDSNPVQLKYYSFIISLDKCTGSCNVLSSKICVPKETKDINVEVFDVITITKNIFHVILNANSIVQHVIQIKNDVRKHVNVNVKIIISAKKIIVGILVHVFVRIASI